MVTAQTPAGSVVPVGAEVHADLIGQDEGAAGWGTDTAAGSAGCADPGSWQKRKLPGWRVAPGLCHLFRRYFLVAVA